MLLWRWSATLEDGQLLPPYNQTIQTELEDSKHSTIINTFSWALFFTQEVVSFGSELQLNTFQKEFQTSWNRSTISSVNNHYIAWLKITSKSFVKQKDFNGKQVHMIIMQTLLQNTKVFASDLVRAVWRCFPHTGYMHLNPLLSTRSIWIQKY